MKTRSGIVHVLFHPVSAKRFVEPLVEALIRDGQKAELWVQPVKGTEAFLSSIKVPVSICPSNLGVNPVKTAGALLALIRRLRERRPLAVYAHLMRGAFLPLLAACITGVPVRIYHNHGAPYIAYSGPLRWAFRSLEWANGHLATHVATDSAGMRPALEAVVSRGMPVVTYGPGSPCGLDASEYEGALDPEVKARARKLWGVTEKDLVLAYIGRPHRRKGFNVVLEGYQRQFVGRKDVKLLVCGCKSEDVSRVLPNPDPGIVVLGYLQDLMPVYQASDAILLPSFHEGFGNCLLEGAAQGCALLASRIPGPDILIKENQNGFLVEPGNINDFVRALKQMDENRAGLRAMGQAAYQKALEFRREHVIGPYLDFMRAALATADSRFRAKDPGDKLAA